MARMVTAQRSTKRKQFVMDVAADQAPGGAARPAPLAAAPPAPRPTLRPSYDLSRLAPRPAASTADLIVEAAPDDDGLPPTRSTYADERAAAEPFGGWLVAQKGRGGLLGQLATAAAGDRGLSKAATPQDLRKRLVEQQADGDMHDALDDAEIDWLAL